MSLEALSFGVHIYSINMSNATKERSMGMHSCVGHASPFQYADTAITKHPRRDGLSPTERRTRHDKGLETRCKATRQRQREVLGTTNESARRRDSAKRRTVPHFAIARSHANNE